MQKVGKPRGLIDYMALSDEPREREGNPPRPIWQHIFRVRTILYTSLWSVVGIALVVALFIRPEIDLTVSPIRNPTYVTMSDGSIRNTYDIRLRNKHGDARPFRISITGNDFLRIELEGTPYQTAIVPADTSKLQRVYVMAPGKSEPSNKERTEFTFWVEDLTNGDRASNGSVFNGKGN